MNLLFADGTKALMIGCPKDAQNIRLRTLDAKVWLEYTHDIGTGFFNEKIDLPIGSYKITGVFTSPSELTMEVKEEWVKKGLGKSYVNELEMFSSDPSKCLCKTKEQSFISYLLSEIKDCKEEKFVIIEMK